MNHRWAPDGPCTQPGCEARRTYRKHKTNRPRLVYLVGAQVLTTRPSCPAQVEAVEAAPPAAPLRAPAHRSELLALLTRIAAGRVADEVIEGLVDLVIDAMADAAAQDAAQGSAA